MRLKESELAEAATILVAVGDGVLADSLRFSLELEGYVVKLCDEYSLVRTLAGGNRQRCLVLDQDVFARMDRRFDTLGMPVVLMAESKTGQLLARAEAAGVTRVVEKPILGNVLFEAIKSAMAGPPASSRSIRPS
jgi:CheY-like chemotaxis protein